MKNLSDLSPVQRKRLTWLARAVLALLLLYIMAPYGMVERAHDGYDTRAYLAAGDAIRTGSEHLYDWPSNPLAGLYIYPPTLAVFFAPIAALGWGVGQTIWTTIQVLCVLFLLWGSASLAGARDPLERVMVMLVASVALASPIMAEIDKGNTNAPVTAMVVGSLLLMRRGKQGSGGVLLALAAWTKLIPGVLIVWLALQKRWRALAGFLAGSVIWFLLPLACTIPTHGTGGPARLIELNIQYVQKIVLPTAQKGNASHMGDASDFNASFAALSQRMFNPEAVIRTIVWPDTPEPPLLVHGSPLLWRVVPLMLAGIMFLLALGVARKADLSKNAALAAGVVLLPAMVGNVLCWPYHLVALALLLAPATHTLLTDPRRRKLSSAILIVAFITLAVLHAEPFFTLRIWGAQTIGLVTLWALSMRLLWLRSQEETGEADKPAVTDPQADSA